MEIVLIATIAIAVMVMIILNIIHFKRAIVAVQQKKTAGEICSKLRVLFGILLMLLLIGGIVIPRLLGGPYGFAQPILQTIFMGMGGYWVINLLDKSGSGKK